MSQITLRTIILFVLFAAHAAATRAQAVAPTQDVVQPSTTEGRGDVAAQPRSTAAAEPRSTAAESKLSGNLFGLDEMKRQLSEQRAEIDELRAALKQQSKLIGELRARVEQTEQRQFASVLPSTDATAPAASAVVREAAYAPATRDAAGQSAKLEERVERVEEQSKKTSEAIARQLGSLTFGGDLRVRYEPFYGQQNALQSSDNPSTLGNPLTSRQRFRLRARFGVRGKVSDEFDWGLRLATGSYADLVATNQNLTDFFTRKPFALDLAYITYRPKALKGFQIQAGKFDTPWTHTELSWDNDISPEGLNESYTRTFKGSAFRNVSLVAWQLPMLERNSAFVLGSDGRVDLGASRRAGRDLALYGAQLRTEVAASKNVSLKFSASDLFFSGTQFITPAQFFGANIQFPATFTIPASGTTPARTITTQVSIPRDFLVAGNSNLGLTTASTNAVNRDGRLSSGYNLVDLIARADISRSKNWPVALLFNFVDNTQTHDVVTAGPAGADVLLPNDQGQGFWAEFQVGKDLLRLPVERIARGDMMFDYAFIRIEKDAILSPFNGSDLGLSTDTRVNRFVVGYALDPRVQLTLTGFFTERPTGLLGAFGQTPPGSLNRTLIHFQFDTILRF